MSRDTVINSYGKKAVVFIWYSSFRSPLNRCSAYGTSSTRLGVQRLSKIRGLSGPTAVVEVEVKVKGLTTVSLDTDTLLVDVLIFKVS